jgi:Tfp pilus assembly protein PilO
MAEAAVGKRIKISKIQQQQMLAVLGASLTFGVSLVFSIFFIKYIIFNSKVIEEKDKAISNYYTAITNTGVCKPNSTGKYSEADLKKCDPTAISVTDIPGTLRYNVLIGMTENNNLESIARESQNVCYDNNGRKVDFTESYLNAKTDEERELQLYNIKLCSSLRVIPDALPSKQNDEALLSSINQIFLISGMEPEALSPNKSTETSPISNLEVIPISLSVEDSSVQATTGLLESFEKSIRSFSFQSATIRWTNQVMGVPQLELSAQAFAFYTEQVQASESQKTIYASQDAKKGGTAMSSSSDNGEDE